MHGKVVAVRPQAIQRRKENRQAMALDSEQNTIQQKDIVKVIDGPHSGRQGEIKHLYRNFAFLSSRMMMENGGIFVCNTRQLVLAGGSKGGGGRGGQGEGGGRVGGGGGFGRGGGRMGHESRDRDLIGQTIKVTQGSYKGHMGIVKVLENNFVEITSILLVMGFVQKSSNL